MKNALVAAALLLTSFSAVAGGNDVGNAGDVLSRLKALNGRTGKIVETYDKGNTGKCRLELKPYDFDGGDGTQVTGTTVSFEDTGMYFTPIAHIDTGSEARSGVITVETSSDRPGGDACGDFGGAIGYKKQITVKGDIVAIRETFRCVLDGFKKYDIHTICQF